MTERSDQVICEQDRDRIRSAAAGDARVVVLTGAGISAESGIETYRGRGGKWTEGGAAAMNRATLAFFIRHPERSWVWNLARRSEVMQAEPNQAHRAIARLGAAMGGRLGLITQNIDRLHLAAGSTPDDTIEIHGHAHGMRCSAGCVGVLPIPDHFDGWDDSGTIEEPERDLLVCPECGFATRPHLLWFDEFYDEVHYRARTAERWAAQASLFVTVGTSGGVPLAPRFAGIARRAGALLVDVNPHDNELRQLACETGGIVVDAPATVGVTAVVRAVSAVAG